MLRTPSLAKCLNDLLHKGQHKYVPMIILKANEFENGIPGRFLVGKKEKMLNEL